MTIWNFGNNAFRIILSKSVFYVNAVFIGPAFGDYILRDYILY